MGEFSKFCGLLRISEVYQLVIRTNTLVEDSVAHPKEKSILPKHLKETNTFYLTSGDLHNFYFEVKLKVS